MRESRITEKPSPHANTGEESSSCARSAFDDHVLHIHCARTHTHTCMRLVKHPLGNPQARQQRPGSFAGFPSPALNSTGSADLGQCPFKENPWDNIGCFAIFLFFFFSHVSRFRKKIECLLLREFIGLCRARKIERTSKVAWRIMKLDD